MVRLVPRRCVSTRRVSRVTRHDLTVRRRRGACSSRDERSSGKRANDRGGAALNEIQYGGRQRRKEKRKMIHSFCTHKSTETPKPWWHNFWRNPKKKSNFIKGRPRTHHLIASTNQPTDSPTDWFSCRLRSSLIFISLRLLRLSLPLSSSLTLLATFRSTSSLSVLFNVC